MVNSRILSLFLIGILVLAGFGLTSSHPQIANAQYYTSGSTVNVAINAGASTLADKAFLPNPVTAYVGDTVTWTNDDTQAHTVTSGTGPNDANKGNNFDSSPNYNPLLTPGNSFSHVFTAAGTFPYFCQLHPTMVGTVNVAGSSSQSASQITGITNKNTARVTLQATTSGGQTTFNISFLDPATNAPIQHVYFDLRILQNGNQIFSLAKSTNQPIIHIVGGTANDITYSFPNQGTYAIDIFLEGTGLPEVPTGEDVVFSANVTPSSLQLTNLVSSGDDTWYIGKGIQQGMYVIYNIMNRDSVDGRTFKMSIYFQGQDSSGNWLADSWVSDQGTLITGPLTLSSVSLFPLANPQTPPEMAPYLDAYKNSLGWIAAFAYPAQPQSLSSSYWGKIASLGGQQIGVIGKESISTPAGTFDTSVVGWHSAVDNKLWILSGFPYPVQALVYAEITQGQPPVQFQFQLQKTGTSATPPAPPTGYENNTGAPITVQTDRSRYQTGDTIVISGSVGTLAPGQAMLLQVFNPNNFLYRADMLAPANDGSYNYNLNIGGPLGISGTYVIVISYNQQKAQSTFSFTNTGVSDNTVWQTATVSIGGSNYQIPYTITGGILNSITADSTFTSLKASITSNSDGTLTLKIPRNVLDAKTNTGADDDFVVFSNYVPSSSVNETSDVSTRTVTVSFQQGTNSIEIVGTQIAHGMASASQAQLQECQNLNIPASNCSDSTILAKINLLEQNGQLISISTDKASYNVGDSPIVTVKLATGQENQNIGVTITDSSGTTIVSRTLTTDSQGSATLQFKIADASATGNYKVTSTTTFGGNNYQQSSQFTVASQSSQLTIISIQATDQQGNPVSSYTRNGVAYAKVVLSSPSGIKALATIDLFDSSSTSLGIGSVKTNLGSGNSEIIISFFIPSTASSGSATIYADSYSDWPSAGGVPLSKEVVGQVNIV